MSERSWLKEWFLYQCWETMERNFYNQWVHGTSWFLAGLMALSAALIAAREWISISWRLALAAAVLGASLGFLKFLGLLRIVYSSPQAFVSIFAGKGCNLPGARRYTFYLGLMGSGFVLLECLVLFGLLGFSTTVTAIPMKSSENWSLAVVFGVYGFFAITLGSKDMITALAWSYFLRSRLEQALNWQGANWLLASGRWSLAKFNFLRPLAQNPCHNSPAEQFVWGRRSVKVCLLLMAAAFALILVGLTLIR